MHGIKTDMKVLRELGDDQERIDGQVERAMELCFQNAFSFTKIAVCNTGTWTINICWYREDIWIWALLLDRNQDLGKGRWKLIVLLGSLKVDLRCSIQQERCLDEKGGNFAKLLKDKCKIKKCFSLDIIILFMPPTLPSLGEEQQIVIEISFNYLPRSRFQTDLDVTIHSVFISASKGRCHCIFFTQKTKSINK